MRIGAGWQKTAESGKTYISIAIDKDITPLLIDETKSISIFANDKKEEEKHPDYVVVMSKKIKKEDKAESNSAFLFE